jgi:hypothetical protein
MIELFSLYFNFVVLLACMGAGSQGERRACTDGIPF